MSESERVRTTVVGSYPFPGWLESAVAHLDEFGPADRAELQDDAVTVAFGLRNMPDYGAAVREMVRVLRPGGRVIVLELTPMHRPILGRLFGLYFGRIVPFVGGRPSGRPVDVLTGFLADDKAMGRPVGVEIARDGAMLVADDVGNTVWRVSAE